MGIVRDLYYARKMSAGLKLPAPTVALLIKRLRLAAAMGGGGIEKTVSGTMVHITDALAKAALSVLASIAPIQSGSGDPAPDNVRPISGLTGLSVYRRGKNLFNPDEATDGKYISSSGSIGDDASSEISEYIPVTVGEKYTWSFVTNYSQGSSNANGNRRMHGYKSDGTWKQQLTYYNVQGAAAQQYTLTATIPSGVAFVRLSEKITDENIQFEHSDNATAYEPYSGNTYAVDWTAQAGTVYGGTVDVVTGQLTVDWASVDMGTLSWSAYGGTAERDRYITSGLDSLAKSSSSVICSIFRPRIGSETIVANMVWIASGNSKLSATTEVGAYANATAFKNGMSGQQLVYELATPLTYQLTPQEVQMLLGENYVWSSSGDTVSVTYYAEGNANPLQSLNILLGGRYSNPKTADDVSDKEALEIILGGNK